VGIGKSPKQSFVDCQSRVFTSHVRSSLPAA